jgi:hypothetical protein
MPIPLQTRDAEEVPEELQWRREEHRMVAVRHAQHLLRWVGGDHGVLIGRRHALVLPGPDVKPPHLPIIGRRQRQHLRPGPVRRISHQHLRQIHILSPPKELTSQQHSFMRSG